MTTALPKELMVFFKPRKPLPFIEPEKSSKRSHYSGCSVFLQHIKDNHIEVPTPEMQKTKYQVLAERRAMLDELEASQIALNRQLWKPQDNPLIPSESDDTAPKLTKTEDPSKTIFVGRLPYTFTKEDLVTEFSASGAIVNAYIVKDKEGKSRGYGFVEFEHEDSFKRALMQNNAELGNRRIIVDYERGRTQDTWFPRRLGGGLGTTRAIRPTTSKSTYHTKNRPNPRHESGGQHHDSRHYRDRDRDRRDNHDRGRERGRDYNRDRDRGYGRESDRSNRYSRGDRYDSGRHHDYSSRSSGRGYDYQRRN